MKLSFSNYRKKVSKILTINQPIIFLFVLFFTTVNPVKTSGSTDPSCPNISGVYQESFATFKKIIQSDCVTLKYQFGIPIPTSGIKWLEPAIELYLDGRTKCQSGTCYTGKAYPDRLHFTLDVPGSVKTAEHKRCQFVEQDYLNPTADSITRIIQATSCDDGYKGPVKIVMKKQTEPK
jgi:hypothetical protein